MRFILAEKMVKFSMIWAIKTPYDKVLGKETIAYGEKSSFFSLIASLKAYLIKQTCEVVVTLTKTPKRRVDQNTFSLNFIGSPNYYPTA